MHWLKAFDSSVLDLLEFVPNDSIVAKSRKAAQPCLEFILGTIRGPVPADLHGLLGWCCRGRSEMFWSCTLKPLIRQIGKPLQRFKEVAKKLVASLAWCWYQRKGHVIEKQNQYVSPTWKENTAQMWQFRNFFEILPSETNKWRGIIYLKIAGGIWSCRWYFDQSISKISAATILQWGWI